MTALRIIALWLGWCQGIDRSGDRRCVDRAIYDAGADSTFVTRDHARRSLCEAVDAYYGGHIRLQDAPGRTKAEVVAALRAAAERAS